MPAYYNEIDPYAAQWLRNLIVAGHIADGDVDERSIEDVKPDDLKQYTQCHFFAGIGVWSYALRNAGWPDNKTVWTGSCPCQPFSAAGKGKGFADERHLWPAFFHLIQQRKPDVIFGEQVASKDGLAWLDLVQTDLEAENYTTAALDLCAAGFGAPHIRQRLYWLADSHSQRLQRQRNNDNSKGWKKSNVQPAGLCNRAGIDKGLWKNADWLPSRDGKSRPIESGTFPLAHGITNRVGRLRAYGNAIVAPVAEEFVRAYLGTTHALENPSCYQRTTGLNVRRNPVLSDAV